MGTTGPCKSVVPMKATRAASTWALQAPSKSVVPIDGRISGHLWALREW
jgi:hypothetical protein